MILTDSTRRGLLMGGLAMVSGCAQPWPAPGAGGSGAASDGTSAAGKAGAADAASRGADVPPPRIRAGDRWRYEKVNLYNGERIGQVDAIVESTQGTVRVGLARADGMRDADEVWSGRWDAIQETAYGRLMLFDAPVPLLPPALEVGSSARLQTTYRIDGDTRRHAWSQTVRAQAWEKVRVPAGEFEALRVARQITFEPADPLRADGRRTDTVWYAPAVNRWVRRVTSGSDAWNGLRRMRFPEDYVAWQLVAYRPAT